MILSKSERQQLKLCQDWNINHSVGTNVIVTKDDDTKVKTFTNSPAYMLGKNGDYPGHTAVIMLEGFSGCYSLERVRADL